MSVARNSCHLTDKPEAYGAFHWVFKVRERTKLV